MEKKHRVNQWIQTSHMMHQKLLNDPHQFSLQNYREVMVHQNTRGSFMECTFGSIPKDTFGLNQAL